MQLWGLQKSDYVLLSEQHHPSVMRALKLLMCCVLLAGNVSKAASNLLINGSFEDPVVSSTTNFTGSFSFSGWSGVASGGSGNPEIVPGVSFGLAPTDGNQAFAFNAGDSSSGSYLEQSFSTSPVQLYTLRFDLGRDNGFPAELLKVEVELFDSTSTHPFSTFQFSPPASIAYSTDQFAFNPISSSTRIRFTDISGSNPDTDLFIDNISITQGVPEPSFAAFAVGALLASRLASGRRSR